MPVRILHNSQLSIIATSHHASGRIIAHNASRQFFYHTGSNSVQAPPITWPKMVSTFPDACVRRFSYPISAAAAALAWSVTVSPDSMRAISSWRAEAGSWSTPVTTVPAVSALATR